MNDYNRIENKASDMAQRGMDEAKKSSQDWLDYVEKHPLQSMVFGGVIFFALKGLFK